MTRISYLPGLVRVLKWGLLFDERRRGGGTKTLHILYFSYTIDLDYVTLETK
jgi:hypothetical protein